MVLAFVGKVCRAGVAMALATAAGTVLADDGEQFAVAPLSTYFKGGTTKLVSYDRPYFNNCPCPCPDGTGSGAGAGALGEDGQPLTPSADMGGEQFAALGGDSMSINDVPGGYIDNPVVATWLRLRYDYANNMENPDRAEFFYAQYGGGVGTTPTGPGPQSPTGQTPRQVNYQALSAYLEYQLAPRLSVFAEVFQMWVDISFNTGPNGPAQTVNNAGFADMITGFKYALYTTENQYLTFQFKTYLPTGTAGLGLGTNHVSYEPGLLYLARLGSRAYFQGQLRYWIPDGGSIDGLSPSTSPYAGDVLIWGAGVGYDLINTGVADQGLNPYTSSGTRLTAVTEFVGWSVKSGLMTPAAVAFNGIVPESAQADIVNLKLGLRLTKGCDSIYAGWGHAITTPRWYEDLFRLEYRRMF